jgi:methionyl-tRNA formyltransferase
VRIAFAGTPEFALPTLSALAASRHRLLGVLTQPDRPAGRGRALSASAVKQLALQLGVPLAQPATLASAASRAPLAEWQPDVLVVAAYGLILPPAVLTLPPHGCINVHASLLPRWRGAAPIVRAILAGDRESGVTIMQMEAGLDTGPILDAVAVPIGPTTTAGALHDQLAQLGAQRLLHTLDELEAGRVQPRPQSGQGVTYAAKIQRAEARIDWNASAERIDRQVRAFNPWPVAETLWQGGQLRIWQAAPLEPGDEQDRASVPPGTVLSVSDAGLLVACGTGVLALRKVQLAGRRVIGAREFAHAASPVGSCLGL